MNHLAVIFTNFGPYHLARLTTLAEYCQSIGWQCTGIELARAEYDYEWQVELECLPFRVISILGNQALEDVSFPRLGLILRQTLKQMKPDVVAIAGYARPTMLTALLWCCQHRKAAILMSETTERDFIRHPLRESIKRLIIQQYSAALVGGKPHVRYLAKLGMPREAIFTGYDVVGNEGFHPDHIRSMPSPCSRPYFLSVSRFLPKKNLLLMISAYACYRQAVGNLAWDLVLCGDGILHHQIKQKIRQLELETHIHLPGFLQHNELLPYFANAGCFIHSSLQEQWGLVVNEAMAAGLPVIVSDRCGCFEDLIKEGVTGFGFDPTNAQQLTDLMVMISSGEIDTELIGENALAHIQNYSPESFAHNLVTAVQYALHQSLT